MTLARSARLAAPAAALAAATAVVAVVALAAGVARAADEEPVGVPGLRQVTAQSAVVGGNAAAARERALDGALRQAVDEALAEMLDPAARTAQAKAVKGLAARARSYVRRYRTLEEGENGSGAYAVRLEVEVDEIALRRAVDRLGQPAGAGAGPRPGAVTAPGVLLVPGGGAPDSTATATVAALATALAGLTVRAQVADAAATAAAARDPAAAVQAAGRGGLQQVAFVAGQATDEGPVRGTGKVAASCRVTARVVAVPTGAAAGEHAATPRAFADDAVAARAACLTAAAGELAPRLVPPASSGAAAGAGGADLRTVTVDADVVEPAAVAALLRSIRSVGAVSSAELRRVSSGRAEIRVRTRSLAPALAPALSRDAGGVITLSGVEVAGDIIRLRVRLRPPPTPPAQPTP